MPTLRSDHAASTCRKTLLQRPNITIHGYQTRYHREMPKEFDLYDTKVLFERAKPPILRTDRSDRSRQNRLLEMLLKVRNHNEHLVVSANKHAYLLKLHF